MMKSYHIDKSKKIKEKWDCGSENIDSPTDHHQEGADLLHGYPWPPRSYTCSFCKREFRSAQALGGHMNVHRRDRARLRQYSPPKEHGQCTSIPNLNVEPSNPNPNFASSSSSTSLTKFPNFTSTITSSFSPSCGFTTPAGLKTWSKNNGDNVCNINHFSASKNVELSKKKVTKTLFRDEDLGFQKGFSVANEEQIVRLDLEIGLVSHKKEDLDLELRLGYT